MKIAVDVNLTRQNAYEVALGVVEELISLGAGVASALIDGLAELKESIVRV